MGIQKLLLLVGCKKQNIMVQIAKQNMGHVQHHTQKTTEEYWCPYQYIWLSPMIDSLEGLDVKCGNSYESAKVTTCPLVSNVIWKIHHSLPDLHAALYSRQHQKSDTMKGGDGQIIGEHCRLNSAWPLSITMDAAPMLMPFTVQNPKTVTASRAWKIKIAQTFENKTVFLPNKQQYLLIQFEIAKWHLACIVVIAKQEICQGIRSMCIVSK